MKWPELDTKEWWGLWQTGESLPVSPRSTPGAVTG